MKEAILWSFLILRCAALQRWSSELERDDGRCLIPSGEAAKRRDCDPILAKRWVYYQNLDECFPNVGCMGVGLTFGERWDCHQRCVRNQVCGGVLCADCHRCVGGRCWQDEFSCRQPPADNVTSTTLAPTQPPQTPAPTARPSHFHLRNDGNAVSDACSGVVCVGSRRCSVEGGWPRCVSPAPCDGVVCGRCENCRPPSPANGLREATCIKVMQCETELQDPRRDKPLPELPASLPQTDSGGPVAAKLEASSQLPSSQPETSECPCPAGLVCRWDNRSHVCRPPLLAQGSVTGLGHPASVPGAAKPLGLPSDLPSFPAQITESAHVKVTAKGPHRDLQPQRCRETPLGGRCQDTLRRFYFDTVGTVCRPFIYSGCGGNGNNFVSLAECQSACLNLSRPQPSSPSTSTPSPPKAALPWASSRPREPGRALSLRLFPSQRLLIRLIEAAAGPARQVLPDHWNAWGVGPRCAQPVLPGPCAQRTPRWAFSQGRCVRFFYGGCNGNRNRFLTRGECLETCVEGEAEESAKEPLTGASQAQRPYTALPQDPVDEAPFRPFPRQPPPQQQPQGDGYGSDRIPPPPPPQPTNSIWSPWPAANEGPPRRPSDGDQGGGLGGGLARCGLGACGACAECRRVGGRPACVPAYDPCRLARCPTHPRALCAPGQGLHPSALVSLALRGRCETLLSASAAGL